jgi:hypothetical protein
MIRGREEGKKDHPIAFYCNYRLSFHKVRGVLFTILASNDIV